MTPSLEWWATIAKAVMDYKKGLRPKLLDVAQIPTQRKCPCGCDVMEDT